MISECSDIVIALESDYIGFRDNNSLCVHKPQCFAQHAVVQHRPEVWKHSDGPSWSSGPERKVRVELLQREM